MLRLSRVAPHSVVHRFNELEEAEVHVIRLVSFFVTVVFSLSAPDVQAGFRKGRGTRDQIANICWIIEKAREFQKKNIYFCFIVYAKAFDCVDHNQLWKILQEMGIPDHLTAS